MSLNVINAASTANPIDFSSMDIETALVAVQTVRSNHLEDQLKDQMKAVQRRNRDIETLNAVMAEVRANRPSGADDTWYIADSGSAVAFPVDGNADQLKEELEEKRDALVSAQLAPKEYEWLTDAIDALDDPNTTSVVLELGTAMSFYGINFENGKVKQDVFDQTLANITAKIDSLNSSQQIDMLRLQSLTNKRNEAFDVMTNFVKKSQDSRSSIVGNMR